MRNWWKWLLGLVIFLAIVLAVIVVIYNSGWLGNIRGITLQNPPVRPFIRPFLNPFGRGILPYVGRPGGIMMTMSFLFLIVPLCLFGLLVIGAVIVLVMVLRPRSTPRPPIPPAQPVQTVSSPAPNEPLQTCPNCGRVVQQDWTHCPYCGAPLK
jgi:hypothetical protein